MDYNHNHLLLSLVTVSVCLVQGVSSCEEGSVLDALGNCRKEREALNDVATSQDSNITHVCNVFEAFARCMDPQVGECQGVSTEAYRRQKEIYTGSAYNCTVVSGSQPIRVDVTVLYVTLTVIGLKCFS